MATGRSRSIWNPPCESRTGLSRATVTDKLRELATAGLVRVHGARQSPKRTYEWTGTETDAT